MLFQMSYESNYYQSHNLKRFFYIIMIIFCNTFFSLHFYKYQYWLWHSATTKKKTLQLLATPEIHSWWFISLSTSNFLSQHSMLYNSQIHSYATSYTFSPTTASIPQFFSKQPFFSDHPLLLHFRKNQYSNDCQHEFRLILHFNWDNHELRLIICFKQGKSQII